MASSSRSSARSKSKMAAMIACFLMYFSAVAHYGLSFATVVLYNGYLRSNINIISSSIKDIQSSVASRADAPVLIQGFGADCIASIPLVVSVRLFHFSCEVVLTNLRLF